MTAKRTSRVPAEAFSLTSLVARLVDRIHDAEEDVTREVKDQPRRWQHRVDRGRVWFDAELGEAHRRLRQSVPREAIAPASGS